MIAEISGFAWDAIQAAIHWSRTMPGWGWAVLVFKFLFVLGCLDKAMNGAAPSAATLPVAFAIAALSAPLILALSGQPLFPWSANNVDPNDSRRGFLRLLDAGTGYEHDDKGLTITLNDSSLYGVGRTFPKVAMWMKERPDQRLPPYVDVVVKTKFTNGLGELSARPIAHLRWSRAMIERAQWQNLDFPMSLATALPIAMDGPVAREIEIICRPPTGPLDYFCQASIRMLSVRN